MHEPKGAIYNTWGYVLRREYLHRFFAARPLRLAVPVDRVLGGRAATTRPRVAVVQPDTGAFDGRRESTADARAERLLRLGGRTPTQRPALAAGAVVGLVIWGMGLQMQQRAAPVGYPEVTLVSLKDGQPATLAQAARGRPVVVNLWASWCGPCRVEMPDLAEAQRRHPDIGFLFANQGESAEKVQAFLARSGLALDEVWLDQGSRRGQAIRSPGLPTTVFLDAQGRQVDAHFGVLSAASLQTRVEALRRVSKR